MTTDTKNDEVHRPWMRDQHLLAAIVLVGLMALVGASVLAGPAGLAGLLVLAVLVALASAPDLFSRR